MNKLYNQPEDFITDDSFIAWVFKTDEQHTAYWEEWMTAHPDKKPVADEAAALLLQVQLTDIPVSEWQQLAAEKRLREAMAAAPVQAKVIRMNRRKIWYRIAAASVVLAVITIGLTYWVNKETKPQLATAFGQIRQDILPDGTEVTLNANSKLTYHKEWKEGTDREVWINGEAFFHVKKTPQKNKFIVHTDAFDIEVTGTSFDVINRNGKSSIVLKEGHVKIHRPGEAVIDMVPGDFIEFAQAQLKKRVITKQDYMAWTENKLVFENTSLKDVAATITEHYGVTVKLDGEGLADRTITGIMPNDNLDALLQALEAIMDCKIQRTNNAITITNRVNN